MDPLTPFHDSNRLEFWPSRGFRQEVHRGLTILRQCHIAAGGTATLSSGDGEHCSSLVLYGPEDVLRETRRRASLIYDLISSNRTLERIADAAEGFIW